MKQVRTTILCILLLLCLFLSNVQMKTQAVDFPKSASMISSDAILRQGIHDVREKEKILGDNTNFLVDLEQWYNQHPSIAYASLIENSMTVKFIDGSTTVLLDPSPNENINTKESSYPWIHERYTGDDTKTAILLHPAESMYGHYQCHRIIITLLRQDYTIEYLANQAVDLDYLKNNLSADIVYMNTHAGYFDLNGDQQADSVVIATGELWTNETEEKYPYEYQNQLIVKGMVGDQGYVAFTPAFIEYYYTYDEFPDSLVFMATCFASYDASMAQPFLDAGARVYVGWSNNTVFWTNSRASIQAFRFFSFGLTVQQVCSLIRCGGFYNWLYHSKLVYFGDGAHRIP